MFSSTCCVLQHKKKKRTSKISLIMKKYRKPLWSCLERALLHSRANDRSHTFHQAILKGWINVIALWSGTGSMTPCCFRFYETHAGQQGCSEEEGGRCEEMAWLKHMWSVALFKNTNVGLPAFAARILYALGKVLPSGYAAKKATCNEWIGTSSKVRLPASLLVYFKRKWGRYATHFG